jgi:hypothetical protein
MAELQTSAAFSGPLRSVKDTLDAKRSITNSRISARDDPEGQRLKQTG